MGAGQFGKFSATVEPALSAVTEVFPQFVERFSDRGLNLRSSPFSWKEFANFIRHVTRDAEVWVRKGKYIFELASEGFSQLFFNSTGKSGLCVRKPYI